MRLSLSMLLVTVAILAQMPAAEAFDVLGCSVTIGANPDDVRGCIEGKVNDRVNQARNEANQKAQQQIHDMQNSPNFARLAGEQKILQGARMLNIEPLVLCLENAKASGRTDLVQYIQRFNGNPGEFVKWIMDDVWRLAESDMDRLMSEEFQELRTPTSRFRQGAQDPSYLLGKIRRLADRHEGARCLL